MDETRRGGVCNIQTEKVNLWYNGVDWAVAIRLGAMGCRVAVAARRPDAAAGTVRLVEEAGGDLPVLEYVGPYYRLCAASLRWNANVRSEWRTYDLYYSTWTDRIK